MNVSIIIVNWNSAAYLRDCLKSIYRYNAPADVEVIIVDNASRDGSREMTAREFPAAEYVQSERNLGFAGANNLGASRAGGQRLLFLNPDTLVTRGAVARMDEVFRSNPDAGAVGCRLLNSDGTLQTSCIQPFPTILNQAFMSDVTLRAAARIGVSSVSPLFSSGPAVSPVQAISGACLMASREAFDAVGGFSEEFFMYTEDVDLCYRIAKGGYRNYYVRDAVVTHHGGGSSSHRKENAFASVQMRESIYKFLKKTRGGLYAGAYRLAMLCTSLPRIAILSAAAVPGMLAGRPSAPGSSLGKWLGILRWSLALERWAR